MRVAIVGGGALGCVYGARLAMRGECDVTVVGRTARAARTVRLERADDEGDALAWQAPAQEEAVPPGVDVAVACVRYEQLEAMGERVAASGAFAGPVVVLTPMLPADDARLRARLGAKRVVAGMAGVVAYFDAHRDGTLRYWLPRAATTLVGERQPPGAENDLVQAMVRAGIDARIEADVLARNVATTVSFVPLTMALDVAGGVEALLADDALLSLALDAAGEGREVGREVGKAPSWVGTLMRFVSPLTLRMGVGLAKSRAPEAVRYVDEHFGRKLHAQNVAMAEGIVRLARERGVAHEKLDELVARLKG